jgi:hypothetical protein
MISNDTERLVYRAVFERRRETDTFTYSFAVMTIVGMVD